MGDRPRRLQGRQERTARCGVQVVPRFDRRDLPRWRVRAPERSKLFSEPALRDVVLAALAAISDMMPAPQIMNAKILMST